MQSHSDAAGIQGQEHREHLNKTEGRCSFGGKRANKLKLSECEGRSQEAPELASQTLGPEEGETYRWKAIPP